MSNPNRDIPTTAPVQGGLVTYLVLDGALKAAEFYVRAFGAEIVAAMPADAQGRTPHVHLHVNGSSLMVSDAFPEHGCAPAPPQAFTLTLMVTDIDARYARAVEAGATTLTPPAEMFWGDRYGQVRDPFGVTWAMNQQKSHQHKTQ
ncbi:glyoxalase/bleomycin resistance/extradiol dioxygenase family protein [Methylobacterium terricola]|uniref:Glyoxalase/bleomycin resistance/extradiol dioxygenase family protein n=1 Tax=Methylobacterium terricola TaxID=2583531 RepID=A0A5C4LPV2_9HYPH|nr:glyoxalase/bleomycin resistance/extradiol dioxygenase family protein [Methylobacterium terricola]TNC16163.1 glyoxalase/bleomycin resistance/extradiol dioxygenase family protein [Methylobacterium terricola]